VALADFPEVIVFTIQNRYNTQNNHGSSGQGKDSWWTRMVQALYGALEKTKKFIQRLFQCATGWRGRGTAARASGRV
jgi:hypothetical protein